MSLLRSWTLACLTTALCLVGCKYDRDDYRLPTEPGQGYLQVVTGSSSVPADGISTLEIVARIAADSTNRDVQFGASLGQLIGQTGTPPTVTVTADASGTARAVLKSSTDLGTCTITVKVVGVPSLTQSVNVQFLAADPSSVISFVNPPTSVLADGSMASPITVAVSPGLAGGVSRRVTLTTNLGSFSPTTQTSSFEVTPSQVDNTATALLYSPQDVGLAVLGAEVAGVKRTTVVSFERAYPDAVQVDLSALSIMDSAEKTLSVTSVLTRLSGKVSKQTRVSFEARIDGVSFGRFLTQAPLTDADGKVTATFSPAGSGHRGEATMIVRVDGTPVSGTARFQVTPPTP